jgi:hypothetical protein
VDGESEEGAWEQAVRLGEFVAVYPTPDRPPAGATEVWLVADERALYLFVRAADPSAEQVRAGYGRRDTRWDDDRVALYLDPSGEGQRAYAFSVNALGVQMDGIQLARRSWSITPWDGIWACAGHRTDDGYQVEMAIPWSSIRRPATPGEGGDEFFPGQIGIFVTRYVPRLGEWSNWPRIDPDVQGTLVHQALVQVGGVPQSAGLAVWPEVSFGWTDAGPVDTRLSWQGVSPGMTVQYAPNSAASLLATFNPDYSQIESNAARIEVNRRYALDREEKRSFFLEGQEWFDHPVSQLTYTRSMVTPSYGVRGTVESARGSVAALQVLDQSPPPSVSEGGGWTEDQLADRQALVSIVRARWGAGSDGYVGALVSNRAILGTPLSNTVVGVDGRARLPEGLLFAGAVLGSATLSATDVVVAPAALAQIGAERGDWWWMQSAEVRAPGFRAENGFVVRTDFVELGSLAGRSLYFDSAVLPRVDLEPWNATVAWSFDPQVRDVGLWPSATASFGNGSTVTAGYAHAGERIAGVWLEVDQGTLSVVAPVNRWLTTGLDATFGTAPDYEAEVPYRGRIVSSSAEVTVQPVPALAVAASAGQESFHDDEELVYAGGVAHVKVEAFATPTLSARLLGDWSSFSMTRSGELLLGWEHSPGRVLYAGSAIVAGDVVQWRVFAKIAWLFNA